MTTYAEHIPYSPLNELPVYIIDDPALDTAGHRMGFLNTQLVFIIPFLVFILRDLRRLIMQLYFATKLELMTKLPMTLLQWHHCH